MSCERYATAIADHACGADLAPDVAAHLGSCVGCAGQLAAQRRAIEGLDDELQQMLAIEPSPFFVQRVQAQAVDATSPRRVRGLWWAVAAVAALVVTALLLTVDRPRPQAIQVQTQTPTPPVTKTPAPTPVAPAISESRIAEVKPVTPRSTQVIARHRAVPEQRVAKGPELDVQVRPGQMQAINRYMALVRSGTLDSSTLSAKAEETRTPNELVIGPLEVSPITVSDLDSVSSPRR